MARSAAPHVSGIHHVTFVVPNLGAGIVWFESVLGAERRPKFDHHDAHGLLFGVILELTGFPGMIELRIATDDYPLHPGYDPVTFEVADEAELDAWLKHLDGLGANHSPIKRRRTGQSIEFTTPDGALLRLFTAPVGGFDEVLFQEEHVDH